MASKLSSAVETPMRELKNFIGGRYVPSSSNKTFENIDPVTGEVSYHPGVMPELGVELEFCPSHSGLKSWRAMAYSPETEAFYIPLTLNCQRSVYIGVEQREGGGGEGGGGGSGGSRKVAPLPKSLAPY